MIIEDYIQKEELKKENKILKKTIKLILENSEFECCYSCPASKRNLCGANEHSEKCYQTITEHFKKLAEENKNGETQKN